MTRTLVTLLVALGAFGDARAGVREIPVRDVTVIQNEAGASRILFKASPTGDWSLRRIRRATLALAFSAPVRNRVVSLRICPVTKSWAPGQVDWTTGWDRPGGDFDEEIYAQALADRRGGSGSVTFDLTGALDEILEEGVFADGFLVIPGFADREGIAADDLAVLQGLGSANLVVEYVPMSSVPPDNRRRRR